MTISLQYSVIVRFVWAAIKLGKFVDIIEIFAAAFLLIVDKYYLQKDKNRLETFLVLVKNTLFGKTVFSR